MNNAKITISAYGNGIAVGLEGNPEEIEYTYNRFFNWGAAGQNATAGEGSDSKLGEIGNSYLHKLGERFSYFLSTESAMIAAMTAQVLAMTQDSPTSAGYKATARAHKKPFGQKFLDWAKSVARQEYDGFSRESFMLYEKGESVIYRELEGGAPDWVSETED